MNQPMNQQAQRQQQVQTYIQGILSALEKDPSTLDSTERRIGSKYVEAAQRVRQVEAELTQLREQSRQVEARVRSLELQHQSEVGRTNGFLETLASLKFEGDTPMPVLHQEAHVDAEDKAPKKKKHDSGAEKVA
jgi:DNA repair exonuclease SbcCD ATPase subunit